MVTDALKGDRIIGMVQPDSSEALEQEGDPAARPSVYSVGCAGRITSFSETGDGRILITLTGICRFRIEGEVTLPKPYRVAMLDYSSFAADLDPGHEQAAVDRNALLATFNDFLGAHGLQADWSEVDNASDEALINALAMISPYAPREKQALLEAVDLHTRAEILIALTDIALAERRGGTGALLQ